MCKTYFEPSNLSRKDRNHANETLSSDVLFPWLRAPWKKLYGWKNVFFAWLRDLWVRLNGSKDVLYIWFRNPKNLRHKQSVLYYGDPRTCVYTKIYNLLNNKVTERSEEYYFLMQFSESGFAIHPSPAKHLIRPSLAFLEYFYGFQNWALTLNQSLSREWLIIAMFNLKTWLIHFCPFYFETWITFEKAFFLFTIWSIFLNRLTMKFSILKP